MKFRRRQWKGEVLSVPWIFPENPSTKEGRSYAWDVAAVLALFPGQKHGNRKKNRGWGQKTSKQNNLKSIDDCRGWRNGFEGVEQRHSSKGVPRTAWN